MLTALRDHLVFILGGLTVLVLLYASFRLFGTRGLLATIGALFLLLIYRKGRTDGVSTTIEKERADVDHAVRQADAARLDAARRDSTPAGLHEDDGFKRPGS